jgi:PncC family amidohydrolase
MTSNPSVAVAESITAGLLASSFVDQPGSSRYFKGGIIAYSCEAKVDLLGVDREGLDKSLGVDSKTVEQMAKRVAELFGAEVGIATSGFAEPHQGHESKALVSLWKAGKWRTEVLINLGLSRNEFRAKVVDLARGMYA